MEGREYLARVTMDLEEAFFLRKDAELRAKLHQALENKEKRECLAAASGIHKEETLDALIKLGITPQTLAAFSLVPLVAVAWSDGELDGKEKAAILKAIHEEGIRTDGPAYQLLETWLDHAPGKEVLSTWKQYVAELGKTLDKGTRFLIHEGILGRARKVAEASGGFLGLGRKISASEARVLAELETSFS